MRIALLGAALLGLAGCAAPMAERPAAVQSGPRTPLPADDPGVLFWTPEQRADRFGRMEDFYAGITVPAAPRVRELMPGKPFASADVAEIEKHLAAMGSVGAMVLQNGKVRYHGIAGRKVDPRWTSFSVAKSFTSTLLGAAVKDGRIALSDPVTKYLPGLKGSAYDGVTVEQVATMTSGVKWNEDYTSPASDVARMLLVRPVPGELQSVTYAKTLTREAPAGSKWVYKTLETNLLGDIVSAAVGRSLADYAKDKIVDPAGFAGPLFWMTDLTGANIGGCCLSLALSDYARMGQWVLEGGAPTVPAGWFAQAAGPRVDLGNGNGYGYQWWTNQAGYGAQGIFGQYITIKPSQRLVIAVVSNHPTATGKVLTEERNALWKRVAEAAARTPQ
ncbi:serine hydrolase domain-containing protein [Qipengyuania sediminis]|uniref:serine hydrolase domain-containing protein n=1 Tax=Qipengyuania sediminis TaxID=1532023 RepID=UPI001F107D32|nr:beta-lactamase family protein [Qipengyuania sediminis]